MKKTNKIELLSPAGSFDALRQAVHTGADAVYLGGTMYSARAYAGNFDKNELKEAIDYAHLYGVKIYITVNTLIFESEITQFKKHIEYLVSLGADALIMQDIGMAAWAINTFSIPVHSSTQMHNYSISNVEYLKEKGFDRAVLARETHIDDIAKASSIMDTEVFVHGALCISYSGQCLFSAFEHGRSGNRGQCAQACRMRYSLYADGEKISDEKYLLSPKDLALLENTEEIIEAGAKSIKLEGRMKPAEYVGYITSIYRKIIDGYYGVQPYKPTTEDIDTLQRLFNRGFTKGYTFELDNKTLMSTERPNHAGVHIGDVTATTKEYITIRLHKPLNQGDGIKFDKADKGFVCNKIFMDGMLRSSAAAGQTIKLENKINLRTNDKLLLTKDTSLLKSLGSYIQKQIPIYIEAEFFIGEPCKIIITDINGNKVQTLGDNVQQSINAPVARESIESSLLKLGDTPYTAKSIQIRMDENIFISKSSINQLRRDATELLNEQRIKKAEYKKEDYSPAFSAPLPSGFSIACTVESKEQLDAVIKHNADRIYIKDINLYNEYKLKRDNIYYFTSRLSKNESIFEGENLVVCDTGGLKYASVNTVVGDYMLNIANSYSAAEMRMDNLQSVCLSVELTDENISELIKNYAEKHGKAPIAEMLVYGRVQLMALKHCILDGNIPCGKCKNSSFYLEDIGGSKFPIKTDENCNNFIFSKEPIDKTDKISYYKSIGLSGVRLDFSDESARDIEKILQKILCI